MTAQDMTTWETIHSTLGIVSIETLQLDTSSAQSPTPTIPPQKRKPPVPQPSMEEIHQIPTNTQPNTLRQLQTNTYHDAFVTQNPDDTELPERGEYQQHFTDNHLQQVLTSTKTNLPFGDLISTPKEKGTIRNFFQNANSIYKFKTWDTFNNASKSMAHVSIDMMGFAEKNIKWDHRTTTSIRNTLQKHYKLVQISTSCNDEASISSYQPGGTLCHHVKIHRSDYSPDP
jgi:hypothetical protein